MKYLDLTGLQKFWNKVKNHVQTSLQGYAKTSDIPDTSNFVTKDENGGVLIQTKQGNNTIEVYEDEQESYISIGSNALGLHGVASISTHDGSYGENGQALMIKDGLVTWGDIPSGGNIDTSKFVTKDEDGNVIVTGNLEVKGSANIEDGAAFNGDVEIGAGAYLYLDSEDGSNAISVYCGNDGKLYVDGKEVATVDDIPNSIPFTYFTCYSNERTVRELLDQLANEGLDTTDSITAVVTFSAMLSGTFLCDISHYYGDYYGCKFTDLTNLKTYYFEGDSRSLSLYDNLSGGSSGEASMPRIRLSNWEYITPATRSFDEGGTEHWNGEIKFSICIKDGTLQEGDELQICALRKTFGKYKLRRFYDRRITAEDIDNLAKQPYLQITTDNVRDIYRTDSGSPQKVKPKFIRIRRPIWGENIHGEWVEVNALFSNVVPVNIGLRFEDI